MRRSVGRGEWCSIEGAVNDQLRAAPVVFVGLVETTTAEAVTFQVEHAIAGIAEGRQVVTQEAISSATFSLI